MRLPIVSRRAYERVKAERDAHTSPPAGCGYDLIDPSVPEPVNCHNVHQLFDGTVDEQLLEPEPPPESTDMGQVRWPQDIWVGLLRRLRRMAREER